MAANRLDQSVKELADEYERVQKKAFTNWVNSHLIKAGQKVVDLYVDFRDGQKLLLLLELLTETKLPREKGNMRFHKLQNVANALDFLQKERKIKLVNIRREEIVDGNPKLTLGLFWTLILHFQISGSLSLEDAERPTSPRVISTKELKEKLLGWAKGATEGYDVKLTNFDSSWRDGMGFCAIINRHRPDLLDFDDCDQDKPLENLQMAFDIAENELGIIRIVDPEDVCVPKPDDKAILTYVSFLHHAFPDMPPPHWKKKPTVSVKDYESLYQSTKDWISDKNEVVNSREFPNTVEAMKGYIADFDKTVTKEIPVKKRDMSCLSDLSEKLKVQKKANIPSGIEYHPLQEGWTSLLPDAQRCKDVMEEELKRLEDLQTIADKVLSECDTADAERTKIEEDIKRLEETSTTMTRGDAIALTAAIKDHIKSLGKVLDEQAPLVQQLKDGHYYDVDMVDQRVEDVTSRLSSLDSRLVEASSVNEDHIVTAVENNLDDLEVWLVTSGNFSNNQQILVQIEEHKAFQYGQLVAAKESIAQINNSPPPPGLEDKIKELNKRWEQVVKQTKDRLEGLEPIIQTVRSYDTISDPLEDWAIQKREAYEQLSPLEVTEEQLVQQKEEILAIKEDMENQEEAVEKIQEYAEQFYRDSEHVQSLADRYARKMKPIDRVARSASSRDSVELEEASLSEQAEALQVQWEWLRSHSDARSSQIDELLDNLRQFNEQYKALRQFVEEGYTLLASEKPVGDTASRIQEQMETCQDFRARISAKQTTVDSMLALGRAVLAEPNTTTQNDALVQKLTGYISDWSDLQLKWQNWYDELHANMEQSHNLSDQLDRFEKDIEELGPLCSTLFPATVSVEGLKPELHHLQANFKAEVLSPYEGQKVMYHNLKSNAQLLPDKQAAEQSFKMFEEISAIIEGHRDELSEVVLDVDGWWDDLEAASEWLSATENTLSGEKPMASSIVILEEQERKIKGVSEDVTGHGVEVERVLKSLKELAKHESLLKPSPLVAYKEQMKSRCGSLSNEVQERSELCTGGKSQLSSYAAQSIPFIGWLKVAEKTQGELGSLSRNKEDLKRKQEEIKVFVEDVDVHSRSLDQVEMEGSNFLNSAKTYQSQLVSYRESIEPEEGGKPPEFFLDTRTDADSAPLSFTPTFEEQDYENGIKIVADFSSVLRKRYEALNASVQHYRQLVDEMVNRRDEFDSSVNGFLEALGEIERKYDETDSLPIRVQERVEIVRSLQVDCLALEPQLQTVVSNYDLLVDLGEGEGGVSLWEGEDEALKDKLEAEKRHQELLDKFREQRDNLSAELSDAQAFLGSFEDFLSWLREIERKMQRDDPLRLEEDDLKTGLTYLKGVASDITARQGAYETLCSKCQDLIDRDAQDSDELRQNLDNAQQRWNAIQIVNDDIEVIEETIPKLESFNSSYSQMSSAADHLFNRITSFSVSAISSQDLEVKSQTLQDFVTEVDKVRVDFDALLNSSDLFDTPFDATKFEADISMFQDQVNLCEKAIASKKSKLKNLEKKVRPMEDLFQKFRTWLSEIRAQLSSLSPPLQQKPEKNKQLQKAKVIRENVQAHRETLEGIMDAVNILSPLVDEPDQAKLKGQVDEITGRYDALRFDSELYPVERWLELQTEQLAGMFPTGVTVPALQDQLTEIQGFEKSVESFRPQLDSLSSVAVQADQSSQQDTSAGSKMATVQHRQDKLNALVTERLSMLSAYLPDIQRYESSKSAWNALLCGWEVKNSALPSLGATPQSLQSQIVEIKSLQQAITDHEPEFVSLKREVNTLCHGSPSEPDYFSHLSEEAPEPPGKDSLRPGQQSQEEAIADYERRLEALKRDLVTQSSDVAAKLDKSNKFMDSLTGLLNWVDEAVGRLNELIIRDPNSAPLEAQQQKCQEMLTEMSSNQVLMNELLPLFSQLTSELPDSSDERDQLQTQLDEVEQKWTKVCDQLKQHQSSLDIALALAKSYEGTLQRLLPWVPNTLEHLETKGPPPAEPDLVEKLKSEVESLKAQYNTLAPVYSTSVEDGLTLSTKCEEGQPKSELDKGINDIQDKWNRLNKLFGDILQRLTDALVQTQEFQTIANGLDRWMDGMSTTLRQQERIAARVKLVEPQIEGFRHILSDITAYSDTVDQVKTLGTSLIAESTIEESQKVKGHLEALTTQFSKLETAAQTRMSRLENALQCAIAYEDEGSKFGKWLTEAEEKLASMEQFPIASQPLKQQLFDIESFTQDVALHAADVDTLVKAEENLFDTELPTIELCEEHLSDTTQKDKLVLPDWLERPGAPEAVEVGGDLRSRFSKLKLSLGIRCDEGTQLLQRVIAYESDLDTFREWLGKEEMAINSFSSPTVTVEGLQSQLEEKENIQHDFKNLEDKLESLNALGTSLIESCKSGLSQTSAKTTLSDINELWGNSLSNLSSREDKLKEGLALAEAYKDAHDVFNDWLTGVEARLSAPLRKGDPREMKRQLDELKAQSEEVAQKKFDLNNVITAGHELEGYSDADPSSLPDIGYSALEERFNSLKATLGDQTSQLEEALGVASALNSQLQDLLKQLEKMKSQLVNHKPPRAHPAHIEKQIKDLSVTDEAFKTLQPSVEEAERDGAAFASQDTRSTPPPEGVPSGADIQKLLSDIGKANEKVDGLLSHWKSLLSNTLETANKFEESHKSLSDWIKEKELEIASADTVRGVPAGVEEQLDQAESIQEDLTKHRAELDSVAAVADALAVNCSPDDATAVKEKVAQLNTTFKALQRSVNSRKSDLNDGLARAVAFLAVWTDAMEAISEKSAELVQLCPVGVDLDTVKSQLEEYKEFEAALFELKPKVTAAIVEGKQLKDSCSVQDEPHISAQLEKLNAAWSQINSDSLNRKHKLDDALLQLGQFHDALAELLTWIVDCLLKMSNAPPPGVKVDSIEGQIRDLKAIEAGISSHAPSVASLNTVGEKLISSTIADNTAEIQRDLIDLNNKWDTLQSLAASRSQVLGDALSKVKNFNDKWKKELSWLTDAENRVYADWKPCGLPDTCQADIDNHQDFSKEIKTHKQPVEGLKAEGDGLKDQGSPDEQKMVDRWVEDVWKRYEDIMFALDEREAQVSYAKERADEFDQSYCSLRDKLTKQEQTQDKQGPIKSEVEAVKQQMEDHKEFIKDLADLEGLLDELDGWGQLLVKDCVQADGEVIQDGVEELRSRLEHLNSSAADRQGSLEESLLSLGEFEEAYGELWAWLSDAIRQLEEAEPITGDPDAVGTQLAKHKALQKQLGARLSSKNGVSKAGKILMKHKTGEDKTVLKKKLQDLEGEWEKACQISVERQDKLENAYKEIAHFRSYVGPLRSWAAKVLPSLDESEPVHGDLDTVASLLAVHEAIEKDLEAYQRDADVANASGDHLIAEILDDPSVTQQDLQELNESWDAVCQQAVSKRESLEDAYQAAESFEDGLDELVDWIDAESEELQSLLPPDEDVTILQQQIEEHKELTQEITVRQPDFDRVLAEGQNLLQVAHPRAVPVLHDKLHQLERKWVDLRGRIGARSEALASVLLELHGLQDMLDNLSSWVAGAETTIRESEKIPIGNDMETVEQQLAEHETFQEEMATQQPNMDALNKIAKKRKADNPHANPEMTKKISSLYKHWQKLWLHSSERHRQLLEARTRLKDIALARSFDFNKWKKRFNTWVDQQKLRVSDLFHRFDSNHDGMLTREELMKALKASGLAINQIELEKIADSFDKDHSGLIDLRAIIAELKGSTRRWARPLIPETMSDSDKIKHEIQHQVSKCECQNKFSVTRVAEGQYRFGDNQKLHLVRILRSTVMVRVGGGWEPLEEFLQKHDPCRVSGRTNKTLRGLVVKKRTTGLAQAGFTTRHGTQNASKNNATKRAAVSDPSISSSAHTPDHVHTNTTVPAVKKSVSTTKNRHSRETTPNQDQQRLNPHHGSVAPSSGRSTPSKKVASSGIKKPSASRLQSPQPRSSTPTSKTTRVSTPTSLTSPRHATARVKSTSPVPSPQHPSHPTPARANSTIGTPTTRTPRVGTSTGTSLTTPPRTTTARLNSTTPTASPKHTAHPTPARINSITGIPRISRIPPPKASAKKAAK